MLRIYLSLMITAACTAAFAPCLYAQTQPNLEKKDAKPADARREIRFAILGDYGEAGPAEAAVAKLIKNSGAEFIITVGDNNYDVGSAATIDANIGQYYESYIYPYTGIFGPGASENRFWPSLGNHDWYTPGAVPYFSYFTLPGNERYYDFRKGPVHFFAIDSDPSEPDGVFYNSVQAAWLKNGLAASTAPFKIVYFHHAPYSSAAHGNNFFMQWPFREWGASVVAAGHDHHYERLIVDSLPYFIDGRGGRSLYAVGETVVGSKIRFNSDYGATFVDANKDTMTFTGLTHDGVVIDTYTITTDPSYYKKTPLISTGDIWRYLDNGSNQGTAWKDPGFNDTSWAAGPSQLGYGESDEATVVGFGPNPTEKFVTTYFRREFQITDPAAFNAVSLEILRDDGAIVYVNGAEVYRGNLPSASVNYKTHAVSNVSELDELAYFGKLLSPGAFVAGTNTIAVEMHQISLTSSDISFDVRLTGLSGEGHLIQKGQVWKYWDQGSLPGADWIDLNYNDSAWASGPAQLGYGEGDESTIVSFGPNASSKFVTTYFRKTFDVSNAGSVKTLVMRILRDDGNVVYLNGREVHRSNLTSGAVHYDTLAAYSILGSNETDFTETSLNRFLLKEGRNVLAVEIHQYTANSSDLSFDLELSYFR
ncbi:MAG: metallophosphoesterase [Planctomycetota bacterium]